MNDILYKVRSWPTKFIFDYLDGGLNWFDKLIIKKTDFELSHIYLNFVVNTGILSIPAYFLGDTTLKKEVAIATIGGISITILGGLVAPIPKNIYKETKDITKEIKRYYQFQKEKV